MFLGDFKGKLFTSDLDADEERDANFIFCLVKEDTPTSDFEALDVGN